MVRPHGPGPARRADPVGVRADPARARAARGAGGRAAPRRAAARHGRRAGGRARPADGRQGARHGLLRGPRPALRPVIDWRYLGSAVGLVDDSLGPAGGGRGRAARRAGGGRAAGADAAGAAAADPGRDPAPAPDAAGGGRRWAPRWVLCAVLGVQVGAGRPGRVDARDLGVRLRAGGPDPVRAPRPARLRPGGAGRPAAAYAGRPSCSPGCAARTCSSSSSRATAGSRSRTRRSRPASTRSSTPAPAGSTRPGFGSPQRVPHLADLRRRSAGWRTRRCSPGCGSTASSATTCWSTSDRLTLSQAFERAGWRTVGDVPANTARLAAGRVLPLRPALRLPQRRLPRARGSATRRCPTSTPSTRSSGSSSRRRDRRPVMAEIDLVSSHTPWSRSPRMVAQAAVGDGSVFDGMPRAGARPRRSSGARPTRVRAAYGQSIEYSLTALVSFVQHYGDDNPVLVVPRRPPAGHRSSPATGADHDVPVTIIAQRPGGAATGSPAGAGSPACTRRPTAPVWRMDAFRDRFLAAFGR